MDRPLIIKNVHNISLESFSGEKPHLLVDFLCKNESSSSCFHTHVQTGDLTEFVVICCATLWLYDVSFVTIKQISITLQSPKITALFLNEVVNATIELVEVNSIFETTMALHYPIVVMHSHFIEIHSYIAKNWYCGLVFIYSNNIYINNVTIIGNELEGKFPQKNFYSNLPLNSFLRVHKLCKGIATISGYNIVMNNTNLFSSNEKYFSWINMSQVVNCNASNNFHNGMTLMKTINFNISNTTLSHNGVHGLEISFSKIIHIDGIKATDNVLNGIYLFNTKWTYITMFTTVNNFEHPQIMHRF